MRVIAIRQHVSAGNSIKKKEKLTSDAEKWGGPVRFFTF